MIDALNAHLEENGFEVSCVENNISVFHPTTSHWRRLLADITIDGQCLAVKRFDAGIPDRRVQFDLNSPDVLDELVKLLKDVVPQTEVDTVQALADVLMRVGSLKMNF